MEQKFPKVRFEGATMIPLSELKSHPKNRNKHPDSQVERLAKILQYQGFRYPVKVSKQSGFITTGHGRVLAAELCGFTHVPVSFQDYDDEAQEYADVQADNAIASWAELDLSGINTDLPDLGPDFDIDMLGIENFNLEVPSLNFGPSTSDRLAHYSESAFRQIVFIMEPEPFEDAVQKLKFLQEKWQLETNTDVFLQILREHYNREKLGG
jgi:hypothetical protein